MREHRASPEARGERLDQVLARSFPDLTRSRMQGLIKAGHTQVDGKAAKASLRLKGGELLSLTVPAPVPAVPVAEELPLAVLHEDRDLVVVDKAAGMVVHPGAGYTELTKDGWALLNKARPTHDEVLESTLSEAEQFPELAPLVAALHQFS